MKNRGIDNPWNVFNYVYERDYSKNLNFMCIINDCKWNSFDNIDELIKISNENEELRIKDIKIKNPDNPSQLRDAKLITFTK